MTKTSPLYRAASLIGRGSLLRQLSIFKLWQNHFTFLYHFPPSRFSSVIFFTSTQQKFSRLKSNRVLRIEWQWVNGSRVTFLVIKIIKRQLIDAIIDALK